MAINKGCQHKIYKKVLLAVGQNPNSKIHNHLKIKKVFYSL